MPISKAQAIFNLKCPRCRTGNLFKESNPYRLKTLNVMNERCKCCSQKFVIEPGFYLGAAYVSYALQVAVAILTYFVLDSFTTFSVNWIIFFIGTVVVLLSPYFIVLSRSFWISFFVSYDPNFKNS